MSEPRPRFPVTIDNLRHRCPLLASVEVGMAARGGGLIGKDAAGQTVVHVKGQNITPRLVQEFQNSYQLAVHAGIIKPKETNGKNHP